MHDLNHLSFHALKTMFSGFGRLKEVIVVSSFQLPTLCYFDKVFASWHLTCKELAHKKMHINWQAQFRIWHVVLHVKKKNHMSTDTLEIEMTYTTRHVTLKWHSRRKCRCQSTFNIVYESITWHFGFEVERQTRFVQRTHWLLVSGEIFGRNRANS